MPAFSWRKIAPLKAFTALRPPAFIRTPFLLSYILVLSTALAGLVTFFRIQPIIPLFYSLARPADWLAPKVFMFIIPIAMAIITLGHLALLYRVRNYDQLLLQLFAWTTFAINLILALSLIRILTIIA